MAEKNFIPFNKPAMAGREIELMNKAVAGGKISGNGEYSRKVQSVIQESFGIGKALLTTSCTDALEMCALLMNIKPGDEVIVPSFSFVSTANAFAMHGARPIFVDIRRDTLNIDETKVEEAVTPKTRGIVPIHYSGVGCDMKALAGIAKGRGIVIAEDAAQAVGAKIGEEYLGSIAPLGTYSFHETKNVHCGEGGALLLNDPEYFERAEILWEKGTNRSKFFRGQVDKYTWVDSGSSYLMSDLLAAYLLAQFEQLDNINSNRRRLYDQYSRGLGQLEQRGLARLPKVPDDCTDNAHIFYLICGSESERDGLIKQLKKDSINAVFHYLPLHQSPMGVKYGGDDADCPVTVDLASRLVRLPLYHKLTDADQSRVIEKVLQFYGGAQ